VTVIQHDLLLNLVGVCSQVHCSQQSEALAAEKLLDGPLKTPEVIEVEFEELCAVDAEITGVKTQYVKMKHYYLLLFVFSYDQHGSYCEHWS